MAASGRDRLVHFKTRLEGLDCPYLDGVEDSWIEELLFKPGEARMRLLQWILGKYTDVNQLGPPTTSTGLIQSSTKCLKINIAKLGEKMTPDCRGTKSRTKQTVFMENLLDLATVADATGQSRLPTVPLISQSAAAYAPTEEQFKHGCYFFDALCRQEDLRDIFRSKIQLFPPDLTKTVCAFEQTRLPDEKHLISVTEKLANELEEQSKQLDDLRENVPLCDADAVTIEKVSKTLSLSLTTMSQVVSGFLHCFETEIKPWCRRPKPLLSEVGPAFSRVHSLLLRYTALLQSFGTIQSSYNQVCQESGSHLSGSRKQEMQIAGSWSNTELHALQGCLSVLEDSLRRLKESSVKDASDNA